MADSDFVELSAIASTAYEASHVIKASSCVLFGLSGYNSNAASQFIQVHDAAALPANTAVPTLLFIAPPGNFSFELSDGFPFSNGAVVCNSSTGPTKTIGAADCWFNALYR
jgi:hypothetical protein